MKQKNKFFLGIGFLILLAGITAFLTAAPHSLAIAQPQPSDDTINIHLRELDKKMSYIMSHFDETLKAKSEYPTRYDRLKVFYSPGNHYVSITSSDAESEIIEPDNIMGTSMAPTINPGNTVIRKSYKKQLLHEGDIICYRDSDESQPCHRVIGAYPDGILTKGDNNEIPDCYNAPPDCSIPYSAVESIVIGVIYTNEDESPTKLY